MSSPEEQFQFRSFLNIGANLEWDHSLIYVSRLESGNVPSYVRLDSRLARRIGELFEVSVTGRNLLQGRHVEFPDELGLNHTDVPRSVFVNFTWRF
jgi:iron complex outermembrane receptor protein